MKRSICQVGDPILRQAALPVTDVTDPEVQTLIVDLIETVKTANGVGIAAPQIGMGLQILVIASRPNARYPHAPEMDPLALINPQILEYGSEQVWGWEGCLSVPDQRGIVARSGSVVVQYTQQDGNEKTVEWQDFIARIFQHEYDHLLGKLFVDHPLTKRVSEVEYLEIFNQNIT